MTRVAAKGNRPLGVSAASTLAAGKADQKAPFGPAAYHPSVRPPAQPKAAALQPTAATGPQGRRPGLAPPVYNPFAGKAVTQLKSALAPPVYNPFAKAAAAQPNMTPSGHVARRMFATAPPSYTPFHRTGVDHARPAGNPLKVMQRKVAGATIASGAIQMVRPGKGATVTYNGKTWVVTTSNEDNPNVSLKGERGKTDSLNWQTATFHIDRPNTENDYDMRGRGSDADLIVKAKQKALDMMKEYITNHGEPSNPEKFALKNVAVANFVATASKDPETGADAEWQSSWVQGSKRTWTLIIDMDRPEAKSEQEPHVGWTLSATSGKPGNVVRNVFGHVWVDGVPASRQ